MDFALRLARDLQSWNYPPCNNDRLLRGTAPAPVPTGELPRRPPTIASAPDIRVNMIQRRVPGFRVDPVLVPTPPARTRRAHNGPSPAPCHRQSGRSLPACPITSWHSCPPRRVAPMHSPLADLDRGAPSTTFHHRPLAARYSFHMIQCRVPGNRADPVLVNATPARPGAHTTALRLVRQLHARARAGAAFRHAPTPRGTAAPPRRVAPMHLQHVTPRPPNTPFRLAAATLRSRWRP
jgi:hypothetical protein